LLTAIVLPPGGSSAIHIYTQTIHRTTQNKQYVEQHKNFVRVRKYSFLSQAGIFFSQSCRIFKRVFFFLWEFWNGSFIEPC